VTTMVQGRPVSASAQEWCDTRGWLRCVGHRVGARTERWLSDAQGHPIS